MSSPVFLVLLVLLAAALHATWNALVRASGERLIVLACVNFTGVVVGGLLLAFLPLPHAESWPYLLASAFLHSGYYFYLLRAYDRGELIQVYPLARGTAPLLISIGGAVFAGELLGPVSSLGVVIASVGIISLSFERGPPWRGGNGAVAPALVTSLWIAAYSITDGLGGRASGNVLSYLCWLSFIDGWPLAIYALAQRRALVFSYLAVHWRYCVAGGLCSMTAYGLVIYAMSLGAMGVVSALRETSVIMAALIGVYYLKERLTRVRLVAVVLVAVGVITMQLGQF